MCPRGEYPFKGAFVVRAGGLIGESARVSRALPCARDELCGSLRERRRETFWLRRGRGGPPLYSVLAQLSALWSCRVALGCERLDGRGGRESDRGGGGSGRVGVNFSRDEARSAYALSRQA
ncbi:hypothetical protein MTO96_000217 [Rhipicephalus appendiculatus]